MHIEQLIQPVINENVFEKLSDLSHIINLFRVFPVPGSNKMNPGIIKFCRQL